MCVTCRKCWFRYFLLALHVLLNGLVDLLDRVSYIPLIFRWRAKDKNVIDEGGNLDHLLLANEDRDNNFAEGSRGPDICSHPLRRDDVGIFPNGVFRKYCNENICLPYGVLKLTPPLSAGNEKVDIPRHLMSVP